MILVETWNVEKEKRNWVLKSDVRYVMCIHQKNDTLKRTGSGLSDMPQTIGRKTITTQSKHHSHVCREVGSRGLVISCFNIRTKCHDDGGALL